MTEIPHLTAGDALAVGARVISTQTKRHGMIRRIDAPHGYLVQFDYDDSIRAATMVPWGNLVPEPAYQTPPVPIFLAIPDEEQNFGSHYTYYVSESESQPKGAHS